MLILDWTSKVMYHSLAESELMALSQESTPCLRLSGLMLTLDMLAEGPLSI